MYYNNYHFLGMHLVWWIFLGIILFWLFVMSSGLLKQDIKKGSALETLKKLFAARQINKEEYQKKKKLIEDKNNSLNF